MDRKSVDNRIKHGIKASKLEDYRNGHERWNDIYVIESLYHPVSGMVIN